jgi:hypothetical protein
MASRYVRLLKVVLALPPRSVRSRLASNGRVSQERPGLRLALLRDPALSLNVLLCLPAIVARFPLAIAVPCPPAIGVLCLPAIAPAARVRASPCAPANLCVRSQEAAADKVVLILRVLLDPVVQVDPAVRKIVLTVSVLERLRPARVLVHGNPARLVEPACFPRLLRIKCRRARSPESLCTRAVPLSASVPVPINARWKASASSIPLGSGQAQATVVP